MNVTLQEITEDTLSDVLSLEVREDQRTFVPPVSVSIAEAHFSRSAWFRAIYADDTPVGFVMLYLDATTPEYTLWRLLIDHRFQFYFAEIPGLLSEFQFLRVSHS